MKNMFILSCMIGFLGCSSAPLLDASLLTNEVLLVGESEEMLTEESVIERFCNQDLPMYKTLARFYDTESGEMVAYMSVVACIPAEGDTILLVMCKEDVCSAEDSGVPLENFDEEYMDDAEAKEQAI